MTQGNFTPNEGATEGKRTNEANKNAEIRN